MTGHVRLILATVLLLVLLARLNGAPGGEVTSLPGWEGPLPSRMYSGYLKAKDSRLFFVYAEAEGVKAQNAPLTVWFNGGN